MKRKVLLLLMVMVLLLGMFSPAYGGNGPPSSAHGYGLVSLGDSTAVGTRPTSFPVPNPYLPSTYPIYPEEIYFAGGYFELLAWYHFTEDAVTHAVDGKDTRDILRDLRTNRTVKNDVSNADDSIVLCVGGNDLLGRVIDSAIEYGISIGLNPNEITYPEGLSTYQKKLYYFESLATFIFASGGAEALNDALETIIEDANLMEGVIEFNLRYPKIIRTMTRLNDDAEIYILNIFNPIPSDTIGMEEIRANLDFLIGLMNGIIARNAESYDNVHLIDVHSAFANDPSTTAFNPLVGSLDPHPTDAGQSLIHELIVTKMIELDEL